MINIRDEALRVAKELEQDAKAEAERTTQLERQILEHKHKHELQLAEERRLLALKNAEFDKEQALIKERRNQAYQQKLIADKRKSDEINKSNAEKYKQEHLDKLMNDIQNREETQLRIINDLMLCSQITKIDAKGIIQAITKGLIPDLFIKY